MPINKSVLFGVAVGLIGAGSMAMQVHTKNQPPLSRAPVEAFAAQVSSLSENPEAGAASPGLSLTDPQGRSVTWEELKQGEDLVLVNFWATWCAPCVKELPSLSLLREKRPGIRILAVAQDLEKTREEVLQFAARHGGPELPVYTDAARPGLKKALPYTGLPTSYILSKQGDILYKIEGDTDWSSDIALNFIDYVVESQKR